MEQDRTASYLLEGKNPDPDESFKDVRAYSTHKPWVEKTYNLAGKVLKVGVVSSLSNARDLIRSIRRGDTKLDFVEVMACPSGCIGGGGQPIHYSKNYAKLRKILYNDDKNSKLRFSHENEDVQKLYNEFLDKPCSSKAHHLLHTNHKGWNMNLNIHLDEDVIL